MHGGRMRELLSTPRLAHSEPVTEVIHGVKVVDPYRWLEDGNSRETREWIQQQGMFTREYLDGVSGRSQIELRIRELLELTKYDSFLVSKHRYVFRKRMAEEEQPSIYVREGSSGPDQLLVSPRTYGTGAYTAIKPLAISPNGKLLAYEVKEGGVRTGRVEFVDLETGDRLPEMLPHGYLRAFAFYPDSQGFCYSIEATDQSRSLGKSLYQHKLGEHFESDEIVFRPGDADNTRIGVIAGPAYQFILLQRAFDRTVTDYYVRSYEPGAVAQKVLADVDYLFFPQFVKDRVFALTNLDAPNLRIVELRLCTDGTHDLIELVPNGRGLIQQWLVVGEHLFVNYLVGTSFKVCIFDLAGDPVGEMPVPEHHTVRLIAACPDSDEVLFECESFFQSVSIYRYCFTRKQQSTWAHAAISLDTPSYGQRQIWYESKDGTRVPMFLAGRLAVLERADNPVILTSYGGFQMSMTPQFSVLVAFLMEQGCVFALPNIRGGGEFGAAWHMAAQRHHRQTAFDDFLAAAEWLIQSGVADRHRIAIFGGSNSGLLVGAVTTQAPHLFRAVVCMAPLLDMIRYHLFDGARKWVDEYGSTDNPEDFAVLWSYSPYHRIVDRIAYPAFMMISGDADQKCNPLHARKMIARLQAATSGPHPIILDYSKHRGHTPVLPLSVRAEALTDRIAFLCDQLGLDEKRSQ